MSRVYPRVCGGTSDALVSLPASTGLSPRVRGNLNDLSDPASEPGSIPACAGEPGWPLPLPPAYRVYPRVCGGTTLRVPAQENDMGLSPRVRGNPIRYG